MLRHQRIPRSREQLRGYDWLTICPKELADRLGGTGALRATGAFHEVAQLSGGGVWLLATADYRDLDDAALYRVFRALAPVLPIGMPPTRGLERRLLPDRLRRRLQASRPRRLTESNRPDDVPDACLWVCACGYRSRVWAGPAGWCLLAPRGPRRATACGAQQSRTVYNGYSQHQQGENISRVSAGQCHSCVVVRSRGRTARPSAFED